MGPDYEATGGPAFPHEHACESGMSLRDYFAGQALVGILASTDSHSVLPDAGPIARHAYKFADAMIEARKAEV